jgi:hypothetical protein
MMNASGNASKRRSDHLHLVHVFAGERPVGEDPALAVQVAFAGAV